MSFGLAHAAMLTALLVLALPPIIHLLSRRRVPTVDWGAMMFLDPGRRARTRIRLAEILLMLARMALLALVAIAATRPFVKSDPAMAASTPSSVKSRRDTVVVIDGSTAMGRRSIDETTPWDRALTYARESISAMTAGDSIALIIAGDRPLPLVDPPRSDATVLKQALAKVPQPLGAADLPGAIAEAFRILESSRNPTRTVILLTNGRRAPWRVEEKEKWRLLRDLRSSMSVPPSLHIVRFNSELDPTSADGSIGALELSRGLVAPGSTVEVQAVVQNDGPAILTRSVELSYDDQFEPGASQIIGPLPPGGEMRVSFRKRLIEPGAHSLALRLSPNPADPLSANDESASAVEVIETLPVLLVDGEPAREPLSGEVDFVRAAMAPAEDESPQFRATTIALDELSSQTLSKSRVLVIANVDRLTTTQTSLIGEFLGNGGGVLFILGDRTDAKTANSTLYRDGQGWLAARIGELVGEASKREPVSRPNPATFVDILAPLGSGESPPLTRAGLFSFWKVEPAQGDQPSRILASLDSGDPWIIERPIRRGLSVVVAGALDAEGGTLPVNPDFVPFVHELIFHLANPSRRMNEIRPGQPIEFALDFPMPESVTTLTVVTPSGRDVEAGIERGRGQSLARVDNAREPGLYRLRLPDPPRGFSFATLLPNPNASDPTLLSADDTERLSEGWPLRFDSSTNPNDLDSDQSGTSNVTGPRPFWRFLVLAALAGLCVELILTRRMARGLTATQT
jgi:von Willebrand factor type A domain/Aerotolerance regulator N-terminal